MRWLDELQRNIENIFCWDNMIYLGVAGVLLIMFLVLYGVYLFIVNIILPVF